MNKIIHLKLKYDGHMGMLRGEYVNRLKDQNMKLSANLLHGCNVDMKGKIWREGSIQKYVKGRVYILRLPA